MYDEIAREIFYKEEDEERDSIENMIEILETRGYIVLSKDDFEDLELRIANVIEKFMREKSSE